jgi:tetratricopeptide (TPR) repeat protein
MTAHVLSSSGPRRGISALLAFCAAVALSAAPGHAATVKGIVADDGGRALAGVEVVLRAGDGAQIIERTTTDDDGVFTLDANEVQPGRELVLELGGYDDAVFAIGPQHLVVSTIELTMKRAVTVEPDDPPPPVADQPTKPRYQQMSDQRIRAIKIYNDAVQRYEKATEEKVDQDKAAAIQMLREAASIDPTFAEPHRLLARLALKQQNWAEAARYAEDLLRIDPDDTEAIRILYLGMIVTRNHFRVGEAARRLAAADPPAVASIEEHARTFYDNGIIVMSRALYDVLVDVGNDPATAYLNLGICSLALDDTQAARAAFESFLELAPEEHPDLEMVREQLAGLQ